MGQYSGEHADALAVIREAGAAVAFVLTTSTRSASTGVASNPTTTTVDGFAIATKPNLAQYQALGLVQTDACALLFVPSTEGQEPPLSATVTWNGIPYTVRHVERVVALDGVPILLRVTVAR